MDKDHNSHEGDSQDTERRKRQQMKLESGRMLTEEEYATEIAVADSNLRRERPVAESGPSRDVTRTNQGGRTMGWVALIFSFVSLFLWPVVMGPTAIVLGAVAYIQGSRAMAVWSMIIGMVAFVAYLVLLPFYR